MFAYANQSVTDGYSKSSEDVEFRKEYTERIGLGFEIASPAVEGVPIGPKKEGLAHSEQALAEHE
jgi:hypothetical protein